MWRYRELLPLDGEPTVGRAGRRHAAGPGRPPGRGPRRRRAVDQERRGQLSRRCRSRTASWPWRCRRPSSSGFQTVGCASTGNLANSVAANAAAAGLEAYILDPRPTWSRAKILGTSDLRGQGRSASTAPTTRSTASARRSPSSTAGASSTSTSGRSTPRARRRWASRSPRTSAGGCPQHVVVPDGRRQPDRQDPQGVQGVRAARPGRRARSTTKMHGAQATGCNPISATVKTGASKAQAGPQAEHDRQEPGDRRPGRRLLRLQADPRDRRLGRGRRRRGDRRRHEAARPRPRASSPRPPAA